MSKANLFLLTILVILLGVFTYAYFQKGKEAVPGGEVVPSIPSQEGYSRLESEGLVLDYRYEGDSRWSYIVKGYAPTPCHPVEIDAIVMESFPEQVSVVATIKRPINEMCILMIEEVKEEGTFSASEQASVSFSVVQED